jgi:glycosyltransferase involved in cell wall biosynthesis
MGADGPREPLPSLRVLALVPYPLGIAPGQRYRMEQWAPYLREEGIGVHFEPFAGPELSSALYSPGRYMTKTWHMTRAWFRRIRSAWLSSRFDIVYLYREAALIGPAWLERLTRWRTSRLLYDFDDAIWLTYVSPRNRYLSYLKSPGKTRAICRMATTVTVGNETLAEFARSYNPNVTVVPSTVSLRAYRPRPQPPPRGIPVVGWTGSHSSAQYLRIVERALQALARRRSFRFLVIGLEGYSLDGVDVECRPWRAETEVEDLWPIDVGIMPLPDDPWARGKCAMKVIQYFGVSVPAVVSPVGANREVVEHGVSGFHATSEGAWVQALERLLDDPGLRMRMGAEGRRSALHEYSAEVQAPRVSALLRDLRP